LFVEKPSLSGDSVELTRKSAQPAKTDFRPVIGTGNTDETSVVRLPDVRRVEPGDAGTQQTTPSPKATPSPNPVPTAPTPAESGEQDPLLQFSPKGLKAINSVLWTHPLDVDKLNKIVAKEMGSVECEEDPPGITFCLILYRDVDIARRGESLIEKYSDHQAIKDAVEAYYGMTILSGFENKLKALAENSKIKSYDDFKKYLDSSPNEEDPDGDIKSINLKSTLKDVVHWIGIHRHEIRSRANDSLPNEQHEIFKRLTSAHWIIERIRLGAKNPQLLEYAYVYLLARCYGFYRVDDPDGRDPRMQVRRFLFANESRQDVNKLSQGVINGSDYDFQRAGKLIKQYRDRVKF
jgi:hypothetical protein